MMNDGAEELFCNIFLLSPLDIMCYSCYQNWKYLPLEIRARHRLTFSLHGRLDPASTALVAPLPVGTLGFT